MTRSGARSWDKLVEEAAQRWAIYDPPAKQDRSRRRQQDILEGAVHVFARHGIARARIADIAARAGVPLSSVYDYYPSKEDLAYALPATRMGQFYAEFLEKAKTERSAASRLRLFLWLTTDFARRNPEWARILYLEIWPSVLIKEVKVRQSIDDFARILVALLRDGAARKEWPEQPNDYETATILIGSVNQLLLTWLLYGRPHDLMEAATSLIKRLMCIIDAPPRSRPRTTPRKTRVHHARPLPSAGRLEAS